MVDMYSWDTMSATSVSSSARALRRGGDGAVVLRHAHFHPR